MNEWMDVVFEAALYVSLFFFSGMDGFFAVCLTSLPILKSSPS